MTKDFTSQSRRTNPKHPKATPARSPESGKQTMMTMILFEVTMPRITILYKGGNLDNGIVGAWGIFGVRFGIMKDY